jgi:hypothetical protein
MDIVNFDALTAQDRIITPSQVDPEEDYFIIGKYTNHYTTNSQKYTKYPVYAIKAGDVISSETKSVTNITPTANITITTTANKNYFILGYIDGAILPAITITLSNPGFQSIGDQIIIISQPDTTNADIDICYDPSNFYLTHCGDPDSPPCSNFSDGSPERDVTIFTYDGAVFCATLDNC